MKKKFSDVLSDLYMCYPQHVGLIESIENEYNNAYKALNRQEKLALRNLPEQFIKRIRVDGGGWTTQLHQWAEEGVHDILICDPRLLSFGDHEGVSVLMKLVEYALGMKGGSVNYELIEKILNTDLDYIDEIGTSVSVKKDDDIEQEDVIQTEKNPLVEIDVDQRTPLSLIKDAALGEGEFEQFGEDVRLLNILDEFIQDTTPDEE